MSTLVMIHSLWRWLVLAAAVLALAGSVAARRPGAPEWARRAGWAYAVALDVQVLIGLIIWVLGKWWTGNAFLAYIHPVAMLLAMGVAHAGRGRERRALAAGGRGGGGLFFYVGSILLLLVGIPRPG